MFLNLIIQIININIWVQTTLLHTKHFVNINNNNNK